MKQRVAVIRGFISDPDLLLMDEPFASVDAHMRMLLQQQLLALWEQARKTVLFVTHDVEEALLLSDRVVVMSATPGRILTSIDVDFPRPRHFEDTWTPAFQELRREIYSRIGFGDTPRRPVDSERLEGKAASHAR